MEAGETLHRYTFGSDTAEQFFCGTCGIHTRHGMRSDPWNSGVDLGVVEGIDAEAVDWR